MAFRKTISESFTRPANTTAYGAGDSVAPASTSITGATNASPIVITAATHGLATGDRVTVASVGGNNAANGDWVVTRISANSFSLDGSVGDGDYTSGGTVTRQLRLTGAGLKGTNSIPVGRIVKTKLVTNNATVTNGTFRVYFYEGQTIQIADNAAWTLLYANRAALIGKSADLVLATEGSGSDCALAQDVASSIPYQLTGDDMYIVLVAEGAYTPTSGQQFSIEVTVEIG